MIRWIALIALILVAFSSSAFGQGFQCLFYYLPDSGTALTTTCNGSTPIPDGRIIKIFWDTDSDGSDLTDPIAPLCDNPPSCDTGPQGTVNYNQFAMDGVNSGYGAGYFYTFQAFVSAGILPDPPRYYLRIYDTDGTTILWTSAVKTLVSGAQEVSFAQREWTCGSAGPQCTVRNEHE